MMLTPGNCGFWQQSASVNCRNSRQVQEGKYWLYGFLVGTDVALLVGMSGKNGRQMGGGWQSWFTTGYRQGLLISACLPLLVLGANARCDGDRSLIAVEGFGGFAAKGNGSDAKKMAYRVPTELGIYESGDPSESVNMTMYGSLLQFRPVNGFILAGGIGMANPSHWHGDYTMKTNPHTVRNYVPDTSGSGYSTRRA